MAISGFGRGKTAEQTATPSAGDTGPGALTAFIDQGSQFEGKLSFKDTVRIDGGFQGEISSENTLIVGETGEVQASIKSKVVVVSGTVIGEVNASEQVILHKTAKMNGDVTTPSLVMEEGAILNGQLSMDKKSSESGRVSGSEKTVAVGEKNGNSGNGGKGSGN
jgi:cytoskeletal protein CcmA (bactofilin family)